MEFGTFAMAKCLWLLGTENYNVKLIFILI